MAENLIPHRHLGVQIRITRKGNGQKKYIDRRIILAGNISPIIIFEFLNNRIKNCKLISIHIESCRFRSGSLECRGFTNYLLVAFPRVHLAAAGAKRPSRTIQMKISYYSFYTRVYINYYIYLYYIFFQETGACVLFLFSLYN